MRKKPMEAVRGKYRLDEINMNILDELNANSRMHLPELSRRVGLASSNSVYQRMKDMEAAEAQQAAGDTISRDAALKACYNGWNKDYKEIAQDIKDLPPAQAEIIRCKECKYWMPHSQLGYDEDNETYHDYCEKLIPEDEYYAFYRDADDYCSRAERRTDDNTD